MARTVDPQVSFADVEFIAQKVHLDPYLQKVSDFLTDHSDLVEKVRQDLERGLKRPQTGRQGLTPPQVLRSLALRWIKHRDLRELRERIADGFTLRLFTDFRSQPVPQHHAFHRAFNRLTPQTLQALNESPPTTHSSGTPCASSPASSANSTSSFRKGSRDSPSALAALVAACKRFRA